MRIAILVWGSLFWDSRDLSTTGEWFYDDPLLPIEFARISSDKRLTLVIKPTFDVVPVLYTISSFIAFENARENLRNRENTSKIENIGFIDFTTNLYHVRPSNAFVIEIIHEWNINKGFDAVIWSDFPPRFRDVIKRDFDLKNVINYIEGLENSERDLALKYILNAPNQIATRFRNKLIQYFQT